MRFENEYKKGVGRRIALSRLRAGLSQKGLAVIMGCHQAEVGYYETGKRVPTDKTLQRLADKLEIDFVWLKYGDESYFDIQEKEFGKSYTINHFLSQDGNPKKINSLLKELDSNELSVIEELCNLLILDKDQSKLDAYFKEKESKYKEEVKIAKKETKRETASSAAANEIAAMYEFYPDVFMRLMKKEIDLEQAYWLTWFKDIENYPRLKKTFDKNPNDLATRQTLIDEMIRIKTKEAKKDKKQK